MIAIAIVDIVGSSIHARSPQIKYKTSDEKSGVFFMILY